MQGFFSGFTPYVGRFKYAASLKKLRFFNCFSLRIQVPVLMTLFKFNPSFPPIQQYYHLMKSSIFLGLSAAMY